MDNKSLYMHIVLLYVHGQNCHRQLHSRLVSYLLFLFAFFDWFSFYEEIGNTASLTIRTRRRVFLVTKLVFSFIPMTRMQIIEITVCSFVYFPFLSFPSHLFLIYDMLRTIFSMPAGRKVVAAVCTYSYNS